MKHGTRASITVRAILRSINGVEQFKTRDAGEDGRSHFRLHRDWKVTLGRWTKDSVRGLDPASHLPWA